MRLLRCQVRLFFWQMGLHRSQMGSLCVLRRKFYSPQGLWGGLLGLCDRQQEFFDCLRLQFCSLREKFRSLRRIFCELPVGNGTQRGVGRSLEDHLSSVFLGGANLHSRLRFISEKWIDIQQFLVEGGTFLIRSDCVSGYWAADEEVQRGFIQDGHA
jgi:hypothetical protein